MQDGNIFSGDLHGEVEGILAGGNVTTAVLGFADVSTPGYVDYYLGCMQEVRVNDELMIPSRQNEHLHETSDVCTRTPQCVENPCQNGGEVLKCLQKYKNDEMFLIMQIDIS